MPPQESTTVDTGLVEITPEEEQGHDDFLSIPPNGGEACSKLDRYEESFITKEVVSQRGGEKLEEEEEESVHMPDRTLFHLIGINCFAFAYGLLIGTFGLITLPLEAESL